MSESYVELLVKRETSMRDKAISMFAMFCTAVLVILFLLTANIIILLGAVIFGVASYFIRLNVNLEYEYLYVDKELSIDKILNKTKRKKVTKVSMERLEILAPLNSYHLADYKNRTGKIFDYSSGEEDANRYMLVYEGQKRIIIEPNEALIKMIKNIAPRKVFTD